MTTVAFTSKNPAQDLSDRIVNLCANINLATYQLLELIAEFEAHKYGEQQGFITTAHWLNYQCGIGLTAAREKVRVALALHSLPQVTRCFREGLVSYSKVRALTRVADAANEGALLQIARESTAAQAERIFRQYRQTLEPIASAASDSDMTSEQTTSRNNFSWTWDAQGNLVFKGRLSPEQGALLLAALQREQDDGVERADAMASMAQRVVSIHAAGEKQSPTHTISAAHRYQIHVELDHNSQHIRGGPGISNKIVERLSCDASLIAHHRSANGEPLSVGRKTRTIPPAIRRALEKRDGGCRFPGCTHRRFVDAHHIQHWARGGETRLSNLVLLCTHHHTAMHERGFRIAKVKPTKGATQFRFYDPQGHYLPTVAGDLKGGQVLALNKKANLTHRADDSAESLHLSLARPPLAPMNPTHTPDYPHINWVLTNFHPPNLTNS